SGLADRQRLRVHRQLRSPRSPHRIPHCFRRQPARSDPARRSHLPERCGNRSPPRQDEFFDLESFHSRGDFLAKAFTYQLYFNLVRPNSHKQNLSPWQIVEQLQPRWPLQLCLLPPVFLDYYLTESGGYDVPRQPYGKTAKVLLPFPRSIREAVHNKMRLRSRDQASDVDSEQIRRRYFLL